MHQSESEDYTKRKNSEAPSLASVAIDNFSKICSGFQSIFICISLIVGGYWTYYKLVYDDPSFSNYVHENGWEIYGVDSTAINTTMQYEAVDLKARLFVVRLGLENLTSNYDMSITFDTLKIIATDLSSQATEEFAFIYNNNGNNINRRENIRLRKKSKLYFEILAKFSRDGVFRIEYDPCFSYGHGPCPTELFIAANSSTASGGQTNTEIRK